MIICLRRHVKTEPCGYQTRKACLRFDHAIMPLGVLQVSLPLEEHMDDQGPTMWNAALGNVLTIDNFEKGILLIIDCCCMC